MVGIQEEHDPLFSYRVNLAERVRPDHPLRAVRAHVDFGFVRELVADKYGSKGNVSVDPAVILKVMFLLFYDDVPSARELMRIVPERLDYLWFLGYGLDDAIPDHSVLSKARKRWGAEVFEQVFARVLAQCVEAGLVEGSKLHMDGSLVDANASLNSVVRGEPWYIAALKETLTQQVAKLEDKPQEEVRVGAPQESGDDAQAGDGSGGGGESVPPQAQEGAESPRQTDEKRAGEKKVNQLVLSTTDPEAAVVRHGTGQARPRYKAHRAVDDLHGVITAVITTPGDVSEDTQLMALVDQHEENTDTQVETVVADHQYGTVDNFRECQQRGITSHMADLAGCAKPSPLFGPEQFIYDPGTDTYQCPAKAMLYARCHDPKRRRTEYTADKATCKGCPLREQCTRSRDGGPRRIKRHDQQEAVDAARQQSHSRAAKRDRVRRRHLMEGSFADAANNHGFKRARWRGLWSQSIQDYLVATIQNIRILIAHPAQPKRAAAAMRAQPDARQTIPRIFTGIVGRNHDGNVLSMVRSVLNTRRRVYPNSVAAHA